MELKDKTFKNVSELITLLAKYENFDVKIYSAADGVDVPLLLSDIDIDRKEKSIIFDYNGLRSF